MHQSFVQLSIIMVRSFDFAEKVKWKLKNEGASNIGVRRSRTSVLPEKTPIQFAFDMLKKVINTMG